MADPRQTVEPDTVARPVRESTQRLRSLHDSVSFRSMATDDLLYAVFL